MAPEQLDPHASMRENGLDSLALAEFLFEVEDRMGLTLPNDHANQNSLAALVDDNGRSLTPLALRGRFVKARKAAGVAFQFRDIRAKTASDTGDLGHSQRLLGHKSRDMTELYVRERIGRRVKPLR